MIQPRKDVIQGEISKRIVVNRCSRAGVSMSSHLESYPQILLHTAGMEAVRWLCGALGEDGFEAYGGLLSAPPSVFRVTFPTHPFSRNQLLAAGVGFAKGHFPLPRPR